MKFLNEVQSCSYIDMIVDYVKGVVHEVLSSDPLEHCLVHFSFRKDTLFAMEVGDACYSVDGDHVDYVLPLEYFPCEKNFRGQMDVIKPVSFLKITRIKGSHLVLRKMDLF